jgi:hypothetical protein
LDDEWYNFSRYTGGCSGSPVGGPTEEDTHCLEDMGLAGDIEFTTSMTDAWCDTRHLAFEKVREAGGWFWQMFNEETTPAQAQCASTLRAACAAGAGSPYYNSTTHHQLTGDPSKLPNLDQDLATFLLQRGPYAFLGWGWGGCGFTPLFPDIFMADLGEPTGFCSETAPGSGVFTRPWTKAAVSMDCNAYKGTVTPQAAAVAAAAAAAAGAEEMAQA